MSNDERMIRVENACMEQAIRIEAQQSQINKLDQALANRDTELIMLRKKHNALCDVMREVVGYLRINSEPMERLQENVDNARIDTGDTNENVVQNILRVANEQEAQDEPLLNMEEMANWKDIPQEPQEETKDGETEDAKAREARVDEGLGKASDEVSSDVDAIMGELRDDLTTDREILKFVGGNKRALVPPEADTVLEYVRPHIGRLVCELQRNREDAMCDMDKMFEQLRNAHNELCDALYELVQGAKLEGVSRYKLHDSLQSARIDTGDTETQDEPQDCENETDAETEDAETSGSSGLPLCADDTGDADVDAIMGELREETNYNARLKSQRETIDFMLNLVRPHIERLVRERDALAVEIERKWRTERDDLLHFKAFYDKFMESTGHLGHQNGTNETSLYNTLRDIARILTGRNSYVVRKLEGKE